MLDKTKSLMDFNRLIVSLYIERYKLTNHVSKHDNFQVETYTTEYVHECGTEYITTLSNYTVSR